jgi:hypothetical protein
LLVRSLLSEHTIASELVLSSPSGRF